MLHSSQNVNFVKNWAVHETAENKGKPRLYRGFFFVQMSNESCWRTMGKHKICNRYVTNQK